MGGSSLKTDVVAAHWSPRLGKLVSITEADRGYIGLLSMVSRILLQKETEDPKRNTKDWKTHD